MPEKTVTENVLAEEIEELYSAEEQLAIAIPQLIKLAFDPALKDLLSVCLEETQGQMVRLEKIGNSLGIRILGRKAFPMKKILEGRIQIPRPECQDRRRDLDVIAAGSDVAQEVIAVYMTATFLADKLDSVEVVGLLTESLCEKVSAQERLYDLRSRLTRTAKSTLRAPKIDHFVLRNFPAYWAPAFWSGLKSFKHAVYETFVRLCRMRLSV